MTQLAEVAAHNLRVDAVSAEVLRAFDREGVATILLKGPSTVRWLYGGEPRSYNDCDLLVSPASIDAAERAMERLGLAPVVERRRMPHWWREHATEWVDPELFCSVDLHYTLKRAGVDETRVWDVLRAETETMLVGGFPATVLTLPGRALLLAVHSSSEDVYIGDLGRAIKLADERIWEEAAHLARKLEATGAFAAGLRLLPEGERLAASLRLPSAGSGEPSLHATLAPPEALTVERLAGASGLRERVAIVRHKLFPPPTFMRHWSPRARRGRLSLLIAYVRRLVWVTRSTPRAVRAWRRARQPVQVEPPTRA